MYFGISLIFFYHGKFLNRFGIYYDDDYDYLQHLKELDTEDKAEMDEAVKIGNVIIKNDPLAERENESSKQKLTLPSSVFASKYEEETGYFNQAAPDHNPKIGWDPDIVRFLDEDENVNFEDPENEFEDDFFLKANSNEKPAKNNQSLDYDEEEENDSDEEEGSDNEQFENDSESQSVKEFETKSKFSNYSMSSSVIRRNEKLKYLDEHFEQIFSQYDEDQIGKFSYT